MQHSFFKEIKTYTHEHPFVKFLIVVAIFVGYMIFTINSFGWSNGVGIALLTRSFFVFCTPIADAGVLLDFPIRTLTGIKMIYSEIGVRAIAAIINIVFWTTNPTIYENTLVLKLFKQILITPYPYRTIIILSAIGSFLSIYFGDEILDLVSQKINQRKKHEKHHSKHLLVIFLALLVSVIIIYYFLIHQLGIDIPLL